MYKLNMTRRAIGTAAIVLFFATAAQAQQQGRIRGQVEKVDGATYVLKARDGTTLNVKLADDARVSALEKASLADIKNDTFIGIAGMPKPDDSIEAFSIHIFLPAQRGVVPDRHGPWDARPNSTMTNAYVTSMVKEKDGERSDGEIQGRRKEGHCHAADRHCRSGAGQERRDQGGDSDHHFRLGQAAGWLGAGEDAVYRPQRDAGDVMFKGIFATIIVVAAAAGAFAQQPAAVRVVGAVENFDGHVLAVKSEKLGEVKINLTADATVFGVTEATIADIKPGAYIGVGATPQPDGSQRAIQVTVLAESQRGLSEGHRPWDARPNSTMTNGTVDQTVASVDGRVVIVKYKDGEKKIIVPPDARILAYQAGDKSELKPGAHIAIVRAIKKPDGSLETNRVNVGRGEVVPQ